MREVHLDTDNWELSNSHIDVAVVFFEGLSHFPNSFLV